VVERQRMLARRKIRSLSSAAQALWDVVRTQASELTAARAKDPLYQL
ncbi:LysR family transcriptional regulator, partial [Salmonella enterica subsp. enterica serovar Virchow]